MSIPNVQAFYADYVAPSIDVPPVLNMISGTSQTWALDYDPGYPPAFKWTIDWFPTEKDAVNAVLTNNIRTLYNSIEFDVKNAITPERGITFLRSRYDSILSHLLDADESEDPANEIEKLRDFYGAILRMWTFFPSIPNPTRPADGDSSEGYFEIHAPVVEENVTLYGRVTISNELITVGDVVKITEQTPCPRKYKPVRDVSMKNRAVRDVSMKNRAVRETPLQRAQPHQKDCVDMQRPGINCEIIDIVEGDVIDIDLTSYTNGIPRLISKPDFLSKDGTHLKGTMPRGQENTIFEVKLEAVATSIATGAIYIRRLSSV